MKRIQPFTLTAGADNFAGGAGNDTINAFTIKADGNPATTLSDFDVIDGGAGNDTLNIYSNGTGNENAALPTSTTVKNVETINIFNQGATAFSAAGIDASKFVGATTITQNLLAANVTNLDAATTAGFKDIATGATLSVQAATAAASAKVNLDGVSDTIASLTVGGTALNAVTVTGSVKDTATNGIDAIALNVNAGATQTTLTLNTAVKATVSLTGAALTTINATGSTGGVNLAAGGRAEVQTIALGTLVNTEAYALSAGGVTLTTAASSGATTAAELLGLIQGVAAYAAAPFTVALSGTNLVLTWKATGDVLPLGALTATGYTTANATETVKGSAGLSTVQTVNTGSGDDTVTIAFATTADKAATVSTGAGKDTITVLTTGTGLTSVDAGDGDDTINVTKVAGNKLSILGGAGNDVVTILGSALATTDIIDGGDGTDTVALAGSTAARTDDDFIVLNSLLKNFETLKFTSIEGSATVSFDAAKLAASYTSVDLFAGSYIDNVGAQALVANGGLFAEAVGYKSAAENTGTPAGIVYAGTLNITEKLSGTVQAHADTVNLTVQGGSANGVTAVAAVLTGEAKTATIKLAPGTDTKGTLVTTDDAFVASTVNVTNANAAEGMKDLATLTISGNGAATVNNVASTKLVTVDASGLNSVDIAGKAVAGLTYVSGNALAETITLGAGIDGITLNASTYGAVNAKLFDTVTGLNLVLNGTVLAATSDTIKVGALTGFTKFTTTQTDLDLALKDAAVFAVSGTAKDNLVFQLGGDTYIYSDTGTNNTVDSNDVLVKLTGTVDLDALVIALA